MICPRCYSNPHRHSRCGVAVGVADRHVAPSHDNLCPELAPLHLTEGEPASSENIEDTMSDQNITATPYPFYATGNDDDSFKATLASHVGASVERNQDAQFAAVRDQFVHRDVVGGTKDARIESLEAKFEIASQLKDSEIRNQDRLARIEALLVGQNTAQLSRELADVKADGRNGKLEALLAAIVAKLP